jgi:hypothetical protein
MGNKVKPMSTEAELEQLLSQCHDLRACLEKSISEILEYAKAFEVSEEDENLELETGKKESDTKGV